MGMIVRLIGVVLCWWGASASLAKMKSWFLSPVDESACNPNPKSLRQAGRNPFNVGHNELATTGS
jgi:hypothetical protein